MGAYVQFDELVRLQFQAQGFSFLPRQPVHSLLAGRRSSRMRGRGLDFAEMRAYVPGDDVRTIDWRVTARTSRPYVRVYTEERDRPALVVVDQRMNMFFGSRVSMKSVVAAELAALAAWRVFHQGDRIGAVVFNDASSEEIRPQRSRSAVLRILRMLVRQNQQLRADAPVAIAHTRLNEVLRDVDRLSPHNTLIVLISDFDGADDVTRDRLLRLARHNDVVAVLAYDPLAVKLPPAGEMVVSNGELQVEVPIGKQAIRTRLLEASDRRIQAILDWQHDIGVPVVPLSTAEDVAMQIRHFLGHVESPRSLR